MSGRGLTQNAILQGSLNKGFTAVWDSCWHNHGEKEVVVKFEFILLALVGAHAPMEIHRYESINQCQDSAAELTEFVELNYTTLMLDSQVAVEGLVAMLVEYNETWEVVPIPIPSIEELLDNNVIAFQSLLLSIGSAISTGQGYGAAAQVNDALVLGGVVRKLLDNAQNPKAPLNAKPDYLIEPNEIQYACIAAPESN